MLTNFGGLICNPPDDALMRRFCNRVFAGLLYASVSIVLELKEVKFCSKAQIRSMYTVNPGVLKPGIELGAPHAIASLAGWGGILAGYIVFSGVLCAVPQLPEKRGGCFLWQKRLPGCERLMQDDCLSTNPEEHH